MKMTDAQTVVQNSLELLKGIKLWQAIRWVSGSTVFSDQSMASDIATIIKIVPVGAIKTWHDLSQMCGERTEPVYMLVINQIGDTHMLQIKNPKSHIKVLDGGLQHTPTNERLCLEKFFNRDFVPTFFIFDNYMHYYAMKMKLKGIGYGVEEQQFT